MTELNPDDFLIIEDLPASEDKTREAEEKFRAIWMRESESSGI